MQIGAFAFHSDATMVSRVGSASAFTRAAGSSPQVASTSGSPQKTPRCFAIGSSLSATSWIIREPLTNVDGYVIGSTHRHSSIKGRRANERIERGGSDAVRECRQADRTDSSRSDQRGRGLLPGGRTRLRLQRLLFGGRAQGDR